jgi:hypothetical protein
MKNFSLSAAVIAISTSVFAHPGNESNGDVLYLEYLFAVGIVVAVVLPTWKTIIQRR